MDETTAGVGRSGWHGKTEFTPIEPGHGGDGGNQDGAAADAKLSVVAAHSVKAGRAAGEMKRGILLLPLLFCLTSSSVMSPAKQQGPFRLVRTIGADNWGPSPLLGVIPASEIFHLTGYPDGHHSPTEIKEIVDKTILELNENRTGIFHYDLSSKFNRFFRIGMLREQIYHLVNEQGLQTPLRYNGKNINNYFVSITQIRSDVRLLLGFYFDDSGEKLSAYIAYIDYTGL